MLGGVGQAVLDGGAARVELGGDLFSGYVFVMGGKLVSLQTEGTDPDTSTHVDLTAKRSAYVAFHDSDITHQKGFRTPLHGGRHPTGWYWRRGVSVFSFKGVYNAPMGTTSRDAS